MKKILGWILAAAMLIGIMPAALAVGGMEEKFPDIHDFYADEVEDVAEDWGLSGIVAAYDTGLMMGTAIGRFSPDSDFTVAQAITVAVRIQAALMGYDAEAEQGEKWYSGYVTLAKIHGIFEPYEFPTDESLMAPVTRGQMAGLFYNAISGVFGSDDKLNDIASIGDIKEGTTRYRPVKYLMELGILTGYDEYGTFWPGNYITRKEAAAVVARVVRPELRVQFTTQEKPHDPEMPSDLTVYTTDKLLGIDGALIPGIFEIGGEYYFYFNNLVEYISFIYDSDGDRGLPSYFYFETASNKKGDVYRCGLDITRSPFDTVVIPEALPCGRKAIGTAEMPDCTLELCVIREYDGYYREDRDVFRNGIVTLGGEYPMVRLSLIGYAENGNVIDLNCGERFDGDVSYEKDLMGPMISNLQKGEARSTARALHDSLINTCTYDPLTAAASYFTPSMIEEAAAAQREAKAAYDTRYNIMLASGYGVCQDYADTYLEMCLRSGIPCRCISGYGNGGGHLWNKVYVDGQWLYVDCTWDDPLGRKPFLDHDYFLIDAFQLAQDHSWEEDGFYYFS